MKFQKKKEFAISPRENQITNPKDQMNVSLSKTFQILQLVTATTDTDEMGNSVCDDNLFVLYGEEEGEWRIWSQEIKTGDSSAERDGNN
jgi:hypothetical protein